MFNFSLSHNLKTYLKLYNKKNQCLNSKGLLSSGISSPKSFMFHRVIVLTCNLKRCNAVSDEKRLSVGLVNPHLSLDPVLPDGAEPCSITPSLPVCLFLQS